MDSVRWCKPWWLFVVALALAVVFWLVGCTSTVKPPLDVAHPVEVYIVYEARHLGLVIPGDGGELVEYGFGDLDWYALGKDRWYHVFDTILWPTRGTLGRHRTGARTGEELRERFPWRRFEPLEVEASAVAALGDRLEREFAAGEVDLVSNDRYSMHFVPHEDGFWCFFNCNDAAANWLEALGCEVSWVPARRSLRIEEAAE